MSFYHNIHCKIWNDDKFPFVSNDCQLVFFHVLTTPMSSQFGLFKVSIPALAAEKRWPSKRYRKAFDEALKNNFWKYDETNLVLLIPKFLDYNKPHSPNVVRSWAKSYRELPECELKNEFFQLFMSKGFPESFKKAFTETFREGPPS